MVATIRISQVMLLLALVASGGCSYLGNWKHNGFKVGPDYLRPAAPVAENWIDFNNPKLINEREGVEEESWWSVFDDPQIDELVASAYEQNLPLRVAGLRVLEAQANRAVAVGGLFPQSQTAIGQYQRIQVSANGNPIGIGMLPIRAFDYWTTGFNMAWELDVWGRFRRSIESADAELDVTIEDHDDLLVSLLAETVATYIEVRAFEQRIRLAYANIRTQQASLDYAETRYRNGAGEALDVAQTRSNLEQTRALIPQLESGLRQSQNRLAILTGVPPTDLAAGLADATMLVPAEGVVVETLNEIPVIGPSAVVGVGMPAELLRRRPDVRRAERQVAAQSARIGIATADLFPAFSIAGSLNWQSNRFNNLFDTASTAGFIAPQFNWKILNYNRIVNSIRSQEAIFQQLAVNYQQTVLNANREAEDAIVVWLKSQDERDRMSAAVEATKEATDLLQKKKDGGDLRDFNRLFTVQRELVVLQDQLAVIEAQVAISLVAIYKALGGGWQIRLNGPAAVGTDAQPIPAPQPADDEI